MKKYDAEFRRKMNKFYQLTVCARWLFILICWLTIGVYGIWSLRDGIALWFDYFTWSAVYYTFHFNFIPTICLSFCTAITLSVLIWQSRNILWGLPKHEQKYLAKQVNKILTAGSKHPLWKWINRP